MISRHAIVWTAALIIPAAVSSSSAVLIDFETTPAGSIPIDNSNLNAPYDIGNGSSVSIFFDINGNNVFDAGIDKAGRFEMAGDTDPEHGFLGSEGHDTADVGFEDRLGDWFLRHPDFGENVPGPLIVDYDTAEVITALSGEIWDIDGVLNPDLTEQWRVDVLDAGGAVLATKLSPIGTLPTQQAPLDGRPGRFFFQNLPTGVDKLRLTFIGTKTEFIGLAFNNFRPFTVPEPASLLMLGAGCAVILGSRRSWTAPRNRPRAA